MSENARKRSRKSKLVPRECVDFVEEDVELEKPEQPPHKKKLLEKIKKEPEDVSPDSATPPVEFSVNVEVEDMDEPLPDDDPSNYMKYLFSLSKDSQEPAPIKPLEFVDNTSLMEMKSAPEEEKNNVVNMSRLQMVLATLHRKHPKEKQAVIHTRNQWGRLFADRHTFRLEKTYADIQLNEILNQWKAWSVCSRFRESPFCYKCYICTAAWWSLSEFRSHLVLHKDYKLQLEIRHQECNVTAHQKDQAGFQDIYLNGKCLKCAKSYDEHLSNKTQPDAFYLCKYCQDRFQTCSGLMKHQGTCPRNPVRVLSFAKDGRRLTVTDFSCKICETVFLSSVDLNEHMEICHKVRSDDPIALKYKVCRLCHEVYYIYTFHICMKKNFNYECIHCYRVFQSKYMLESHQRNWKGVVKCDICDKFIQKGCMAAEHYALHSDNFRMVYRCLVCKKTKVFCIEESLRVHMSKYHKRVDCRHIKSEKMIIPTIVLQECLVGVVGKNVEKKTFPDFKMTRGEPMPQVRVYVPVHANKVKEIPIHHVTVAHGNTVSLRADNEPETSTKTTVSQPTEIKPENIDVQVKDAVPVSTETERANMRTENELETIVNKDAVVSEPFEIKSENYDLRIEETFTVSTEVEHANMLTENEPETIVNKEAVVSEPTVIKTENELEIKDTFTVYTEIESVNNEVRIKKEKDSDDNEDAALEHIPTQESTDLNDTIHENISIQENTDVTETVNFDISNIVIKSEKIDDDEVEKESTVHKDKDRIMEELYEFLDMKPDVTKVKEEKHTDDESRANLSSLINISKSKVTDSIVKVFQAPSTFAEEVTDDTEFSKVFQVSKSLLNPETVAKTEIKEEVDDDSNVFNSSSDSIKTGGNSVTSENSESLINLEPEVILQAGYKKRKIYKCTKCDFSAYHREYKEHVKSLCKITSFTKEMSHSTDAYICTKCNRNFPNIKKYALHFDKHGYGYMSCPQCLDTFDSITRLVAHLNTHIKNMFVRIQLLSDEDVRNKVYLCKTCKEVENSKNSFEHWEKHLELRKMDRPKLAEEPYKTDGNEPALKASVLKEVLATLLQEERRGINGRDIKFCFICNRRFERRNDGKRHLIEHLLEDALANIATTENLKCQICSELHKKPDGYKKHMRDHASLPIYQCRLCDKSFSDSSNFTKHKKIHNLKAYVCDICNKKFQAKFSLEKHMEIHMTTDPITCDRCDKVFYCQSFYKRHVRQYHDKIANRFKCSFCRDKFNSIREKWDHMWLVHKHRKEKADCPVCGKSYRKIADVKKHAQTEHNMTISLSNVWTILGDIMKEKEKCAEVKQESDSDDCMVIEEERETLVVYD